MNSVPNSSVRVISLVLMAASTLSACRAGDEQPAVADSPATATRADTAGGMGGMRMSGMKGAGMMDSMHTHMGVMDTMSGDRMKQMLPMHRQMVANMLSQMNSEMRSMNMPANTAWTATVDSLRQDIVRMPDVSGPELKVMMPAHRARMTRLMQMHRDMMAKMRA